MAPRRKYWQMVDASRAEACLAARLYNDPSEERSFESFVVHMHLAWLYLLHAEFARDDIDIRYRRRDMPTRLDKIDGEPRKWELSRCITERWDNRDAVRLNLEFFIALRNKIEHRYTSTSDLALSTALAGHAQAFLLNYEEEIVANFGEVASLATRLRFPVFIGSFTDQGERTLQRLRKALPQPLRQFIAEYQAALPEELASDHRYEFRLRVFNELAPRDPDAIALQYTRYDDMTEEQKEAAEQLGRKGLVVVREQHRGVVNLELLKPRQVVNEVAEQIPFVFHMGMFIRAWKTSGVRPMANSDHPERTDEKYCYYDSLHKDYGYTPAYVRKLVRELKTVDGWRALYREDPQDKVTGEWIRPGSDTTEAERDASGAAGAST